MLGKELDVHWYFSERGDHYLGRILANMDSKKPSFGNIPSHWKLQNPMENEDVAHTMYILFGCILKEHKCGKNNPCALLC